MTGQTRPVLKIIGDFQSVPPIHPRIIAHLLIQFHPTVIDATRHSDGRLVCLKRVPKDGPEIEITKQFSLQSLRDDPRNHCIPVLDTFDDDTETDVSYIVMPFLRRMDNPPFDMVNDVLDFVDQVVEVCKFAGASNA